jgi:hypothetical protein
VCSGVPSVARGFLPATARAALRVHEPDYLWTSIPELVVAWTARFPESGSAVELALCNEVIHREPSVSVTRASPLPPAFGQLGTLKFPLAQSALMSSLAGHTP